MDIKQSTYTNYIYVHSAHHRVINDNDEIRERDREKSLRLVLPSFLMFFPRIFATEKERKNEWMSTFPAQFTYHPLRLNYETRRAQIM